MHLYDARDTTLSADSSGAGREPRRYQSEPGAWAGAHREMATSRNAKHDFRESERERLLAKSRDREAD
jgi:hypothetical protein